MKFFLKISCTALLISLSSLIDLCAQEIVWSFHLDEEINNIPDDFWVAKNGDIVINVRRQRPPKATDKALYYQEKFLLKLNKKGEFTGNVYIDACKNKALFLPFRKGNYLTYGNNCIERKGHFKYGSRLFDRNGNLLQLGEVLPEHKIMQHISLKKLTFFSRELGLAKPDVLYIGQLNKKLKISYDSISIIDLKREEYNMNLKGGTPGKVRKSAWVVPINYGPPGKRVKNSHKGKYGGIFYVEKDEMKWHYTPDKYGYFTREIETHKDNIYVLFSNPNRAEKFLINFDKYGKIKNEAKILLGDIKVIEMKYFNKNLIVLSKRYINYFSPTGEQLKRIKLPTVDEMRGMTILKDGSVILTAVKDKKTFVFKLGKKNKRRKKTSRVEEI